MLNLDLYLRSLGQLLRRGEGGIHKYFSRNSSSKNENSFHVAQSNAKDMVLTPRIFTSCSNVCLELNEMCFKYSLTLLSSILKKNTIKVHI